MTQFKRGDKIRKIKGNCQSAILGDKYVVMIDKDGQLGVGVDAMRLCTCQQEWELITSYNENMNPLTKLGLLFKGEPQKSFIKAGVTDASEIPTDDGVKLVVAYLLRQEEFSSEFKKNVVDPILADEEKE